MSDINSGVIRSSQRHCLQVNLCSSQTFYQSRLPGERSGWVQFALIVVAEEPLKHLCLLGSLASLKSWKKRHKTNLKIIKFDNNLHAHMKFQKMVIIQIQTSNSSSKYYVAENYFKKWYI